MQRALKEALSTDAGSGGSAAVDSAALVDTAANEGGADGGADGADGGDAADDAAGDEGEESEKEVVDEEVADVD